MAGVDDIPDEILGNILSRLPPKPMGRSRCVSTRWNRLISDPSFMMSRSSRIFLSWDESDAYNPMFINLLDESNGSVTDLNFSMFKDIPTIENWDDRFIKFIGTFNGIVVLAVRDYIAWDSKLNGYTEEHMILYNPFTGVYEICKDPFSPLRAGSRAYGFGYGATPDELKIFRFRNFNRSKRSYDTYDVFNLKTRLWSQEELIQDTQMYADNIGTFLKGYLYWMGPSQMVALDVDKMVFSEMHLPDSAINQHNHLGTCRGCLWMITNTKDTPKFDVWVKNEQGVDNNLWSKTCSFTIALEPECDLTSFNIHRDIEITEDGRILMDLGQMIIYDTSKQSYEKSSSSFVGGIKYNESLISPFNI